MFEQLTLDSVECDWLTFSTEEKQVFDYANSVLQSVETDDTKVLQYVGKTWSPRYGGSMFAGEGLQGENVWYLIRLSGMVASRYWRTFVKYANDGLGKVTRFDIQTTTLMPDGWSQKQFMDRLHDNGQKPSLIQSTEKETGWVLATVSLGARKSEVYVRVYEKIAIVDKDYAKCLRFEAEYKGDAAPAVAASCFESFANMQSGLRHRMEKIKDEKLVNAFPVVSGVSPVKFVIARDDFDKREHWFIGSVAPALQRFLNETNSRHVANVIQDVITSWEESEKIGILPVDEIQENG